MITTLALMSGKQQKEKQHNERHFVNEAVNNLRKGRKEYLFNSKQIELVKSQLKEGEEMKVEKIEDYIYEVRLKGGKSDCSNYYRKLKRYAEEITEELSIEELKRYKSRVVYLNDKKLNEKEYELKYIILEVIKEIMEFKKGQ